MNQQEGTADRTGRASSSGARWERRNVLKAGATGCGFALAGCLERLGFEEQSAWNTPPLIEDRPDAVYVPAGEEEMAAYGQGTAGDYAVSLTYTFPHRFWLVSGERHRVDVQTEDTHHLMMTVWDDATGVVLPADLGLEIVDADGDLVHGDAPWSMLAQRMGFHYGDNVTLPEEGSYTARIQVGPVTTRRTGDLEGRLESTETVEIPFEYARADVRDLELISVPEDEQGTRGALEVMSHGSGNGHEGEHDETGSGDGHGNGAAPAFTGPAISNLPGTRLGTERSGDADITAIETDLERLRDDADADADADTYLAVFPRTPYNDVPLPFTSLSATLEADGETLLEEPLVETLDHEFGHHYGLAIDDLTAADRVTVSVDTAPQVARHDGYETAFFDFEPVSFDQ
ncbi:DUF7350 domain-containing protein [Natronosalvus caseinilyticus]|uniref:DUF7350 domain-containing protein n=1 Tax=Natronosalvus caseinilyticus TaxID=2953747 RepID=UPI0028A84C5B|nr:hypothetical protein [Natronosalvus caseinilyticus]